MEVQGEVEVRVDPTWRGQTNRRLDKTLTEAGGQPGCPL